MGHWYTVVIDKTLAALIYEYIDLYHEDSRGTIRIFSYQIAKSYACKSYAKALRESLRNLGIDRPGLSPHSFRVSFATEAYARGMSLQEIKTRLGLRSVDQASKYIRYALTEPGVEWISPVGPMARFAEQQANLRHDAADRSFFGRE